MESDKACDRQPFTINVTSTNNSAPDADAIEETLPGGLKATFYISGADASSPLMAPAIRVVRELLQQFSDYDFDIETVDCALHPERAERENVIAVPCLILRGKELDDRFVGDLIDVAAELRLLIQSRLIIAQRA